MRSYTSFSWDMPVASSKCYLAGLQTNVHTCCGFEWHSFNKRAGKSLSAHTFIIKFMIL